MEEINETEKYDFHQVPVLPIRGLVIFPGSVLHFDIARNRSIASLTESMKKGHYVFITAQIDTVESDPSVNDLYSVGVFSRILQIIRMTDNIFRIVVEGLFRAKAEYLDDITDYFAADLERAECISAPDDINTEAMINVLKDAAHEYAVVNQRVPQDMIITVSEMDKAGQLADYVADNLIRDYHNKQQILSLFDEKERLSQVIGMVTHEISVIRLEEEISEKTKGYMDQNQREYYLRERIRAIQDELGESSDEIGSEIQEYQRKINELNTTDENKEKLIKELRRLEKSMGNSAEANVIRSYLDSCLELPWGKYTKEKLDIRKIAVQLDKHHYGLKKVKENIIEYLAVRKLNPDINGQIICLVGPPGVGKTSIAHSIAESTGRNYQRIALGGVHDEAEIRGHRRTYIGAMMGRIMAAVNQSGSANPLILLDEVDKLGQDFRGDPTSALLEVLDGEQNSTFYDHYIDMPFDLSKILFITTANDESMIPSPLRDRMEMIRIDSYTREEKFNIAKQHLVTKQLKRHGLTARNFRITDEAIYDIIDSYSRESGVRNLERVLSVLMNKTAVKIVSGEKKSLKIGINDLEELLGARKYKPETLSDKNEIGIATGLAWTAVGGETMPIEVAVMEGSGKVELTGSLGDVMKESAHAAFTCIRTMADEYSIDPDFYKSKDIHIHVPEGAVPKDGPSAGITMAAAITSALTGKPIRRDVAMTGEITIRGKVLPIGGLKEKTMAAYRLGINTVIIPEENVPDLDDVEQVIKDSIRFVPAGNIRTVLETALIQTKG